MAVAEGGDPGGRPRGVALPVVVDHDRADRRGTSGGSAVSISLTGTLSAKSGCASAKGPSSRTSRSAISRPSAQWARRSRAVMVLVMGLPW